MRCSDPRPSRCRTSPRKSHVTVWRPMWGCGGTSIAGGRPRRNASKRSRKHHGPTIRLARRERAQDSLPGPDRSFARREEIEAPGAPNPCRRIAGPARPPRDRSPRLRCDPLRGETELVSVHVGDHGERSPRQRSRRHRDSNARLCELQARCLDVGTVKYDGGLLRRPVAGVIDLG